MREKLRASKGLTMVELLVTLMIVSLIGLSLTAGINSAVTVYRDSTRLFEAETLCGTILTCLEDEFRFSRNIHKNAAGEAVFDSQTFGGEVKVSVEEGKILIGGFPLLGDKAYTSGLRVLEEDCKIDYNEAKDQVSITIAVSSDVTKARVEHTVAVTPVGN